MNFRRLSAITLCFILCAGLLAMLTSCTAGGENTISVDTKEKYQTMEGFGASAAWWAQDVGGWTEKTANGKEAREEILELLYGENGIGLDIYRYNLGAGAKAEDASHYSDPWRKTQSFIAQDGSIDYTLDANAVWCMQKAVELGTQNVVLFSNSAPNTMTVNGKTHSDADEDRLNYVDDNGNNVYFSKPNLDASQYQNFANYVLDAAMHFQSLGVPVKAVSPINEPQWAWQGGQEGCHYEPEEVVALYKVFLSEMQARNLTQTMELSMFESGQPTGDALKNYLVPIMNDQDLAGAIKGLDTHSYWANPDQKEETALYLNEQYKDLAVRCTEWTEMVNGKDVTMDSALVLANTMLDDLRILNAESWSYWIAVSAYDYRDGLIYVDRDAHTFETTKRLFAMGNFSKFIEPGAVRIGATVGEDLPLNSVAFDCGDTVAVVVVNSKNNEQQFSVSFPFTTKFQSVTAYVTDSTHNLESTGTTEYTKKGSYTVSAKSVTTFVFEKRQSK